METKQGKNKKHCMEGITVVGKIYYCRKLKGHKGKHHNEFYGVWD